MYNIIFILDSESKSEGSILFFFSFLMLSKPFSFKTMNSKFKLLILDLSDESSDQQLGTTAPSRRKQPAPNNMFVTEGKRAHVRY